MIILTETTDTLKAVLSGSITTNQMRCFAGWRDITTSAYTPGRTLINTNNTTPVSIVGSPVSNTQRVVDFISIYNADSVSQTLTVLFNANGTDYILWSGVLNSGERLEYHDGQGFRAFTNTGGEKVNNTVGMIMSNTENVIVLASDITNNNAVANTIADVTGLTFAVTAGLTYWFAAIISYTAAATTTGSRWSITGPAAPTLLSFASEYPLTATTQTVNYASAFDIPAAANASSLLTGNVAYIEGIIKPAANGNVTVRFASEVANSAIIAKAGSFLRWRQLL
jgi:hypothetical protein